MAEGHCGEKWLTSWLQGRRESKKEREAKEPRINYTL
jgi:hypothetical protein